MRDIYGDGLIDPTYDKYFTWDRYYGIKFEPAKSIKIDFSATNNARIDEPYGALDTQEKEILFGIILWTSEEIPIIAIHLL